MLTSAVKRKVRPKTVAQSAPEDDGAECVKKKGRQEELKCFSYPLEKRNLGLLIR